MDPVVFSTEHRRAAVRALLVDRLTAEVVAAFEQERIEVMLVKGPVIAAWLYPDGIREYGDSDFLLPRGAWERAVSLLERMGFRDQLGPLAHPRMESYAGTAFVRGTDNVDLHCTLAGLEADFDSVWRALRRGSGRQRIAGRAVEVPGPAATLLHIALHAVHHVEGRPLEDLRRAAARGTDEEWQAAAELAGELHGLAAFASGLRLVPAGEAVARRIGVHDQGSVHFDLRTARVPMAEGLDELLSPGLTTRERARMVAREVLPRPEFMRWWTPLAKRGTLGLVASYPWRWIWLAAKLPGGLRALRRARRRHAG